MKLFKKYFMNWPQNLPIGIKCHSKQGGKPCFSYLTQPFMKYFMKGFLLFEFRPVTIYTYKIVFQEIMKLFLKHFLKLSQRMHGTSACRLKMSHQKACFSALHEILLEIVLELLQEVFPSCKDYTCNIYLFEHSKGE